MFAVTKFSHFCEIKFAKFTIQVSNDSPNLRKINSRNISIIHEIAKSQKFPSKKISCSMVC